MAPAKERGLYGEVAKLVDAKDLKSFDHNGRAGSSPVFSTKSFGLKHV